MNQNIKYDFEAIVELNNTRKNPAKSGYRPQINIIDNKLACSAIYFTETEWLPLNRKTNAMIQLVIPKAYMGTIWIGKKVNLQEGEKVVGCATVTKVFNKYLLKNDNIKITYDNNSLKRVYGEFHCCNRHEFEVKIYGKLKKNLFGKISIIPNNTMKVMEAICKKCNNNINSFSNINDKIEIKKSENFENFTCLKCNSNSFKIEMIYVYPTLNKLKNIDDNYKENEYIVAKINLKCNNCEKEYKMNIDYKST